MNFSITYKRVSTDDELRQILELQKQNTPNILSETDLKNEGFVTVQHNVEILKRMNNACAHCIATHNNKVVGYALSMLQDFKDDIPVLQPMFSEIDTALKNSNLNISYVVMGQICIAKDYRGGGVFRELYQFMKQELKEKYNAIITEVDVKNTRSLNAHIAVGFKVLKNYRSNNQDWAIVILET